MLNITLPSCSLCDDCCHSPTALHWFKLRLQQQKVLSGGKYCTSYFWQLTIII